MVERTVLGRCLTLVIAIGASHAIAGCADGGTMMGNDHRDGSLEGGMDAGAIDTGVRDTGTHDTGPDAPVPERDSAVDAGPHITVDTCEACTTDLDCGATSYCAQLVDGTHACLLGCNTEFPSCPRSFTCIFDATGTGVHANICAPIGGPCCVDADADHYGVGVGCMGPDCNDTDPAVHPNRDEICDGIDTNCNAHVDEEPNDCVSGRCSADGDGTYSSLVGGTCNMAMCQSGTTTDCALYTCHDGGSMGTTCATMCAPTGTDDDNFCIASAHCDAAMCTTDVSSGGTCDEDSDCASSHCDNGFCCASGQCCATTADCPGGGALNQICDDPTNCQGHHGVITCVSNACAAMSGINDDTACNATFTAHTCGTYNPIVCNGMDPQTPQDCPTSCIADSDCIAAAHCDTGFCIPDRPPGSSCTRNEDCVAGIGCIDRYCCATTAASPTCGGQCEACNVAGMEGTCAPLPGGSDPAGECSGFSCNSYYVGFSGNDVCASRQPVTDAEASCDGARHCRTPDMLCPLQLPGVTQIDCNNTCQSPRPSTCTGTTAGACDNLDATAGTNTCGVGPCATTVAACVGGLPQMCMAGPTMTEVCDGADNNCNGIIDDGAPCNAPAGTHVAATMCGGTSNCRVSGCEAGYFDYNITFSDGCECNTNGSASTCTSPVNLGMLHTGDTAVTYTANIGPTNLAYFTVGFPIESGGTGRGGSPQITVTPAGATGFSIRVLNGCGGMPFTCNGGTTDVPDSSTGVATFAYGDGVAGSAYTTNNLSWPTATVIEVHYNGNPTPRLCSNLGYTVTVSR